MGTTTKRNQTIVDSVVTECYVYAPTSLFGGEKITRVKVSRSLWDTGASATLVSSKITKVLNLVPIGKSIVSGYNSNLDVKNSFLVHVGLPTGDVITNVVAMEFDGEDYDMVIGMDIICKGDFALTNKDDRTTFSFRIPSTEELDFTQSKEN